MKTIWMSAVVLLCVGTIRVWGQGAVQTQTPSAELTDGWARASLAAEQLTVPVMKSPAAIGYYNILVKMTNRALPYPTLSLASLTEVTDAEREALQQLEQQLRVLRDSPPSWQQIVDQQAAPYAAGPLPAVAASPAAPRMVPFGTDMQAVRQFSSSQD